MRSLHTDPVALQSVLPYASPAKGTRHTVTLAVVDARWCTVVGESFARVSRVLSVEGATVRVGVSSAVVGAELEKRAPNILMALGPISGKRSIRRLLFDVVPVASLGRPDPVRSGSGGAGSGRSGGPRSAGAGAGWADSGSRELSAEQERALEVFDLEGHSTLKALFASWMRNVARRAR